MSYKVQLKTKGSKIVMDMKFPYNQIHNVPKKVFDYIKETFPDDFNFFEPKKQDSKKQLVKERTENKQKSGEYNKKESGIRLRRDSQVEDK